MKSKEMSLTEYAATLAQIKKDEQSSEAMPWRNAMATQILAVKNQTELIDLLCNAFGSSVAHHLCDLIYPKVKD